MSRETFSISERRAIAESFALLREYALGRCRAESELSMIDKAFDIVCKVHDGVRDRSGKPYVIHCIEVAQIVVHEIGLGYKSICAALLHDIFDNSDYTIGEVSDAMGPKIAALVEGLSKIKTVLDTKDSLDSCSDDAPEDFRNILLTLGGDVRVILIKLADRLHNCRNIACIPDYKRAKVLTETMDIFIPLSHRLGLYSIKSEMENIYLRYTHPEEYDAITEKLSALTDRGGNIMKDFLVPVRQVLDSAHIRYEIKERIKTPYSIWYKIHHKNVSFEQISDLFAVRIIFSPQSADMEGERNECFQIFSLITSIYSYRPERVRNWISCPKQNGYEALHLTCNAKDDTPVEVQIRSERMDDIAERGISAHWKYKRLRGGAQEDGPIDLWMSRVRDILEKSEISSINQLDLLSGQHNVRDIFIFDENDRIHTLPSGSSAMDYASTLGPELSSRVLAAKINHRLCLKTQPLSSGDKVELITTISERQS